jgi:DNA-binding response OmpR family regulator
MKILIAVDNVDVRSWLETKLLDQRDDVVAVGNGRDAWDVLTSADPPQIVLLDWDLPGLGGPKLCRKARSNPLREQPYVILLLNSGHAGDVPSGLEAGADDYLLSPLQPGELDARLAVAHRVMQLQSHVTGQTEDLYNSLLENGLNQNEAERFHELLCMCAWCKQVRSDEEGWQRLERYIENQLNVEITHGICPECSENAQGSAYLRKESIGRREHLLTS